MEQQNWEDLLEEAPVAVNACLRYFQERYMGNWQLKILRADAIFAYLNTKGYEVTVSTFGVPNRTDWYYEIHREETLLKHERNFVSAELAALQAITFTFLELEKAHLL